MIKIEFFHDTICSFCFPMSYRMRKLKEQMPEVKIIHRSFALAKEPQNLGQMFGTREKAKEEVLMHWQDANSNDDLHRFNIEGMKKTDFLFPYSLPALLACKAAYFIGGDDLYWDVFDRLQSALFVDNQNIEEITVIEKVIQSCHINLEDWRKYFYDAQTNQEVEKDIQLAERYGIHSVPCLIVNETHKISGAQPLEAIMQAVKSI